MNLGKLLGVGKSFFGGGVMAQYRVDRRACLPKFNEGKNPFAYKPAAAVASVTAAAPTKPAPAVPMAPPAAGRVPSPVVVTTTRMATPTAVKPAVAKPAEARARTGWAMRLNPFRTAEAEPAASAAAKAAVQAELSLDAVKVVHNDLADADVEVVPARSHANAPVAAPILPPARRAWEYVGENLLKSS
jgi:hypothetical protein